MNELDSLESVELALCIEEELGNTDEQDIPLLARLRCQARRSPAEIAELKNQTPCELIVIGQSGSQVLCVAASLKRFGVGHEGPDGIIRNVTFYQSLQRALFSFRQS